MRPGYPRPAVRSTHRDQGGRPGHLQSARERPLPPARRPERHPGRGRPPHGGARPHRGRGRLGEDARPDAQGRVPDPRDAREPGGDPVDHVHEQGGARDGGPGRRSGRRPRRQGDVDPHVPLDLRADPASRARPPGHPFELHDLRRRRHRAPDRGRAEGSRPRSQTVPTEGDGGRDRPGEGSGRGRGPVRAERRQLLRRDRREGLLGVRASQACRRSPGLRRPDHRDRPAVQAPPGGPGALPRAVPLHPCRRVSGHEPGAVPTRQPAGVQVSQRLRRGRRGPGRLLVARRDHQEHPRLRARLSRRGRLPDGAELPLHAEHPGHRERR